MYISNKIKAVLILLFCTISFSGFSQNKNFKVTLDAGHGAHDFGAVYHGHVEKNIALAVVLKVGKILESQPNIDVNYTRKTDVFIDLIERAKIANRVNANIFVSIHCNANKNTVAEGTETYVMGMTKNASNLEAAKKENSVITLEKDYKQKYEGYDPNSPETLIGMTLMQEEYLENSISLASKVQDKFTDDLGKKNRGLKQAPFMVLHKAYMPRVLIEMGFISNKEEGAILDSEEGQNEIAKAIADAIVSYKKEYFGNGDFDTEEEKPAQKMIEKAVKDTPVPVKKEIKINSEVPKQESKTETKGTIFKVQLSASSKKVALIPSNFKGLKNISIAADSNIYKYMYGETSDYVEAKKYLEEAKSKGYNSAFLIAFENGKKISIQEALK
ncbi:N-acetylmuramoyl-L-alanine amidase [Flavobacterium sp.]|uniref:N-acetylmuramoyl-L-alanine amidase family protein n=1 Tax=Flavobacterium sp. TaxID=239 RepID=UPI002B4B5058|nr:N-acetylmuramoyl-L-alanine amidase [Flavobacterium sp.]HLF51372.1 N-acetylmuramoyl-L-alanine amidase [Flavobacterium sp.]